MHLHCPSCPFWRWTLYSFISWHYTSYIIHVYSRFLSIKLLYSIHHTSATSVESSVERSLSRTWCSSIEAQAAYCWDVIREAPLAVRDDYNVDYEIQRVPIDSQQQRLFTTAAWVVGMTIAAWNDHSCLGGWWGNTVLPSCHHSFIGFGLPSCQCANSFRCIHVHCKYRSDGKNERT